MAAEANNLNVTQQEQPRGPPVSAATSVAEIPAPMPPGKTEEGNAKQADQPGPVSSSDVAAPEPGANESATATSAEPKLAAADNAAEATEATKPALLPTTAPGAGGKETNGEAKQAATAPEQPTEVEEPAKQVSEAAAPTDKAAPAAGANGDATKKDVTEDAEMKDVPAPTAPETSNETPTKRSASDAFGADADTTDAQRGNGKKIKTDAGTAAAVAKKTEGVDQEATGSTAAALPVEAPAEKAEKAEKTEKTETTNGKEAEPGAAPLASAAAKKAGRPKKQQGKPPAPVGRTARKTRSQGPAV